MCRLFVVAATMLLMLVHSILGCCWHHTHAVQHVCVSEQSDTELLRHDRVQKSCGHGHQHEASHEKTNIAKLSLVTTESPDDSDCPSDDQSPCEEDRCVDFWSEATKQKIGFADLVVDLAIGQPAEFVSSQLTSSVRWLVLENPQANPLSPRARTQVWVV